MRANRTETNRNMDWQANKQKNRQTDRQTDRQTERRTDRQMIRQAGRQAGRQCAWRVIRSNRTGDQLISCMNTKNVCSCCLTAKGKQQD
jgi:hypothetical protein